MKRYVICCILMVLLSLYPFMGISETKSCALPSFAEYLNSEEEHREILRDLELYSWDNAHELDWKITAVAIGPDNQVAIRSSSAAAPGRGTVTIEYRYDGTYLSGHCQDLEGRRGGTRLFYTKDGKLCYFYHLVGKIVCIVGETTETDYVPIESYTLPTRITAQEIIPSEGCFIIKNDAFVFFHNDADYYIAELSPARLVLKNNETFEAFTVCDYTQSFEAQMARKHARSNIWVTFWSVVAAIVLIVYNLKHSRDGLPSG